MNPAAPPLDGLPPRQRGWAILTVGLGLVMAVLDSSIANVALPSIARDLRASPSDSVWVVNAYQLAVIVTLLPFASLGDIRGYRRIYQGGLMVFTVASLLCALSGSLTTLSLARVVQGFGAAGIMSVNTALLRVIYPRRMLGFAMGINATMVAVSSAVGPTAASVILSALPWQFLFYVNVPIGLVVATIGLWTLPATPRSGHQFDIWSAVLNAVTLGLLIVAIDGVGHGQRPVVVVGEFAAAGAAAVLLVRRQLSKASPLLPVDLLRIPIFALSIGTSIGSFCAQALAYVSLPFYLQGALGRSAVETGFLMTPWPLTIAVVAPLAGRLSDRVSPGLLGGLGLVALAGGLAALAYLPADAGTFDIVWRMAVCGLGFGVFQTPNNRAMIGAAPPSRSGGRERDARDGAASGSDGRGRTGVGGVLPVDRCGHVRDAVARRGLRPGRRFRKPGAHQRRVVKRGGLGLRPQRVRAAPAAHRRVSSAPESRRSRHASGTAISAITATTRNADEKSDSVGAA